MPLYDYKCSQCGHTVERLVKPAEADSQTCPKDGAPMERQASAPGAFRFNFIEE